MDPITLAGGISLSLLDRKPVVNAICGCCGAPGHLSEALIGTPVACPRCRRFQIFAVAPNPRQVVEAIPPVRHDRHRTGACSWRESLARRGREIAVWILGLK